MTTSSRRLTEDGIRRICDRLVDEVGGYLRIAIYAPGVTCAVCAGPVTETYSECYRCHLDRQRFGKGLADLVVPISYGIRDAQSGHLMWTYKDPTNPVRRYRTLLTMLLLAALGLHERCIERRLGRTIDTWAVVPSTGGRFGEHPLRIVARGARFDYAEIELTTNPRTAANDRATEIDRFAVGDPATVAGKHILVIDDTWATGARSQSAALALKQAGAALVTVLVLARWLNPQDGSPSERFRRRRLPNFFDPRSCPVSGRGPCT